MAANTLISFNRLNPYPLDVLQVVANKSSDIPYPTAYVGQICYETSSSTLFVITAKSSGTITWTTVATGTLTTNFLNLTDTPDTYTGQSLKIVRVANGANTLEFVPLSDIISSTPDSDFTSAFSGTYNDTKYITLKGLFSNALKFTQSLTASSLSVISSFLNLTYGIKFSSFTNSSPTSGHLWQDTGVLKFIRPDSSQVNLITSGDAASTSDVSTGTSIATFVTPSSIRSGNITFGGNIIFSANTIPVFQKGLLLTTISALTPSSGTANTFYFDGSNLYFVKSSSTQAQILDSLNYTSFVPTVTASSYQVLNSESSASLAANVNHLHYFNQATFRNATQSATTVNFNTELQTVTLTQGTSIVIDTFSNLAIGKEVILEVNCGSTITGTLTVTGGNTIVGSGTSFTTLGITTGSAGNTITISGNIYGISSVNSNTSITLLTGSGTGVNAGITFSTTNVSVGTSGTLNNEIVYTGTYNFYQGTVVCGTALAGTISVSGTTMTGVGTSFNTSTTPVGSVIWINTNSYTVSSITSTTVIVLTASGTTVSNGIGIVLAAIGADFTNGLVAGSSFRIGNLFGTVTPTTTTATTTFATSLSGNTNTFYNATLTKANNFSFNVSGITTIINSQFISGITNYISLKAYSATKVLINFFTPRSF